MKTRGRKKAGDLVVIDGGLSGQVGTRPEPPSDLTARQAELWRSVVNDEPLDYFETAATREMLKAWCIRIAMCETLTDSINVFPIEGHKSERGMRHLARMLNARDIEMRGAASLATKLRLTNQSRYTPRAAASASANTIKGIKPWDWER